MESITYEQIMRLFATIGEEVRTSALEAKLEAKERAAEFDRQLKASALEAEKRAAEAKERAAEADKRAAEFDRQLKASALEAEKRAVEAKERAAEFDRQLKASALEADKRAAEFDKRTAELSRRMAETERYIKNVSKQVGDITDTLGRFSEEQVRPKILELFKGRNVYLDEIHPRVRVQKEGRFLMEIDLLLVNTIYSVVVEVKNTLRQSDVDEHLERMMKLQEHPIRLIKGTVMYGAVAGMIVTDEVEKYATKKGFYVIKPKGDGVEITNLPNFEPKEWVAAS